MNARELIVKVDKIAREQGMTQSEWCRKAGFDIYGKRLSRAMIRGDCKVSTFIAMLAPLGIEIKLEKKGETADCEKGIST